MDPPLRFSIRRDPVRVRLPRHAIGYSPAARSIGWRETARRLWGSSSGARLRSTPDRPVRRPGRCVRRPGLRPTGRSENPLGLLATEFLDRPTDRGIEVVVVERLQQPVRRTRSFSRSRSSTKAMLTPCALSSSSRRSSMSAAVTSMSVTASHCSTNHRGRRRRTSRRTCWRKMPALAKNSGASHGTRAHRPPRERPDSAPGCASRRGPVSCPSTSPCGHQLRRKNSRIDSTTASRMPCRTPSRTTPTVATSDRTSALLQNPQVLAEDRQVHERERSGDHDGGERRLWEVAQQRREEHEQHDDHHGADEPRHLALRARLLGDRGPR